MKLILFQSNNAASNFDAIFVKILHSYFLPSKIELPAYHLEAIVSKKKSLLD